jgi:hypothetical protein
MRSLGLALILLLSAGCGDDETEADALGVGAQCTAEDVCDDDEDDGIDLVCLIGDFKGGYCGLIGCAEDADCPEASACIAHDDGENYCFRTCVDKPDCNAHRDADNEANCSGSADFVEGAMGRKACVPPSSG